MQVMKYVKKHPVATGVVLLVAAAWATALYAATTPWNMSVGGPRPM